MDFSSLVGVFVCTVSEHTQACCRDDRLSLFTDIYFLFDSFDLQTSQNSMTPEEQPCWTTGMTSLYVDLKYKYRNVE